MSLLGSLLPAVATFVAIVLTIAYIYFKHQYSYWKRRNVPFVPPSIPLGNMSTKSHIGQVAKNVYMHDPKAKVMGFRMLHSPCLMINDPELIRLVLIEEFSSFSDHGTYVNEKEDPLQSEYHFYTLSEA